MGASGWQILTRHPAQRAWGLALRNRSSATRARWASSAPSPCLGPHPRPHEHLPLHVEILYNEYQFAAAFAVASLLMLLALVTLVAKAVLERQIGEG
jgi:sulfate/thiosulfate transport system permease protein